MAEITILFMVLLGSLACCVGQEPAEYPSLQDELQPALSSLNSTVQCYDCQDCAKVYDNTTVTTCPLSTEQGKQIGCVTYAEQYRQLIGTFYVRGCATARGTCQDIKLAHNKSNSPKLLYCKECYEDKCNHNSAFKSYAKSYVVLLAFVISPFKKLI